MLDLLRRKAQSPYLQATVLIIIIVFVFWGVGGNQSGARNAVATVNGEPITLQEFDQAYKRTVDNFSKQFGGNLPKGFLEAFDLKRQVINELIQKSLLLQGGKEMGIYVSDMEIQNAIKEMTVFQNNGAFDVARYKEVLKGSRLTPTKFESSMRTDLLVGKVAEKLGGFGRVTPHELTDRFRFNNSESRFDYVAFKADDYKDKVEVTEEALNDFFEKNKENYKTAPQIKLKYLSFTMDKEMDNISIPEAEIEEYYTSHQNEYGQPEKRSARHILLKTTDENQQARKEEIEKILARTKTGEDFADLAKEFSEDGSAARGGDLGFFSRGQMVKPFEDAVFSMKVGEISDVVTTRFGHHIIKLEGIQPGTVKPLADVRGSIEQKLKRKQAQNSVFEKANDAYEKIIFAGSLANYASKFEATLSETEFFPQASPPQSLAGKPAIIKAAFSLKKGELSSLIDSPAGYYILFVDDVKDPEIPELDAVRAEVEKDFIAAEAKIIAQKDAQETLAAIRDNKADFAQTIQDKGLTVQISDYISRSKRTSAGLPGQVVEAALPLTAQSPYPQDIIEADTTFYLCRFKDKRDDGEENNDALQAFKKSLVQEKEKEIMDAWIAHLMKRGQVTINEKYLN